MVADEPLVRLDVADYLAEEGFEVIEAADADEAIRALRLIRAFAVFLPMSIFLDRWMG